MTRGDSIDPETGIAPISEWGNHCARGFVSDARFGPGNVIERTNRDVSRKWRRGASEAPRLTQTTKKGQIHERS